MERRARGGEHGNVAGHETELARLLVDRGRLPAADTLLVDAIGIFERLAGPESPQTALPRALRGVILTRAGDFEGADSVLHNAARILEAHTASDSPPLREINGWLAELHDARSRQAEVVRDRAGRKH